MLLPRCLVDGISWSGQQQAKVLFIRHAIRKHRSTDYGLHQCELGQVLNVLTSVV